MKLNYKLKLIAAAVVLGVGVSHANARQTTSLSAITSITQNSDSWVAIENQDGIKVSCTQFNLNGVSYLKVKFENTTNQLIDFLWSLKEGNEVVVNETRTTVKANSFVETDNNTLILFNNGDSYADFSFNIKLK